jgi:H/ACA ribonucleoprotein complex subunit 4
MMKENSSRFLVREKAETNPDYGYYPLNRPIEEYIRKGIVVIDKPSGPTSHEVVSWIRKILEIEKTGHSGTLDPRVTGVLPVLLGEATKLAKLMQGSDKEYICVMRLHETVSQKKIENVLNLFTGKIYQRPPLKSAVKRRVRVRNIKEIELIEVDGRDVLFRVLCEAGTYIRKLCYDIGEVLGCGAHMQELRRIRSGVFTEGDSFLLQDLKDAYHLYKEEGEERYLREIIQPMEKVMVDLPKIVIKDSAVDAICHGAGLTVKGIAYVEECVKKGGLVGVFTLKNEAVAWGVALHSAEELVSLKEGMAVISERVVMERGVYPRVWRSKK